MPTAASPQHDPSKMSAYPFRFATSPHNAHPPPPGHPLSQYMQQQQQMYGQRFPFQQPTIPSPGMYAIMVMFLKVKLFKFLKGFFLIVVPKRCSNPKKS